MIWTIGMYLLIGLLIMVIVGVMTVIWATQLNGGDSDKTVTELCDILDEKAEFRTPNLANKTIESLVDWTLSIVAWPLAVRDMVHVAVEFYRIHHN